MNDDATDDGGFELASAYDFLLKFIIIGALIEIGMIVGGNDSRGVY